MRRQVLSRSYDCFFAEFLGELSLVRLALLEQTTCVGLRYGFCSVMLRDFSWRLAFLHFQRRTAKSSLRLESQLNAAFRIYQEHTLTARAQIQ